MKKSQRGAKVIEKGVVEAVPEPDLVAIDEPWADRDLRAYQVIGKSLLERIRSGEFKTTGKLPTERDLAEIYGVGRAIIRDALVMLEVKGAVQSRQGSGIYIMPNAFGGSLGLINDAITSDPALHPNPQHLISAHQWLDSQIARLATGRHSEDDAVEIEKALRAFSRPNTAEESESLNREFHRRLAISTHNYEFLHMSEQTWGRRLQSSALRNISVLLYGNGFRSMIHEDHKRTVEFIRRGDGEGAFYSMWHHYENMKNALIVSEALPPIQP